MENILGSKGAAVRQISAETNARISVMDGMPGSDERVAIITSREDPTQELSGAQVNMQASQAVSYGLLPESQGSAQQAVAGLIHQLHPSTAACTCAAQSALQLVHMKILEGDEPNPITGGFVCRILCCNTQAGSVIGK